MTLLSYKARNHPQQVSKRGANPDVDERATSPEVFDPLQERFRFTLDAAAQDHNAKCAKFFTPDDDGLVQSWAGERVWCNPPYSDIRPWVVKAWDEFHQWEPAYVGAEWCRWCPGSQFDCSGYQKPRAELVVMLLPANRTEKGWWQETVEPFRDRRGSPLRTEFFKGRLRFIHRGATEIKPNERPPFGCVLLIWE